MIRVKNNQSGFSAVEAVLVVVIIAAIAGVGYYVMRQKQTANDNLSGATSTTKQAAVTPTGTTANIDQLTQQDSQTEFGVDNSVDNQMGQDAASANTTVNNVGGAYNEANL